jgi:DNA-directed RNA polymerase specialized sigma24 family protein
MVGQGLGAPKMTLAARRLAASERRSAVVVLRVQGFSVSAIARRLGCARSTVVSDLRLLRRWL